MFKGTNCNAVVAKYCRSPKHISRNDEYVTLAGSSRAILRSYVYSMLLIEEIFRIGSLFKKYCFKQVCLLIYGIKEGNFDDPSGSAVLGLVCGLTLAEIVGLNLAADMNVCLL
jgi:hypothetical protein